jgi:hypothetical protein
MNFSRGWAVSALLIIAATAAHAEPVGIAGAARSPYLPVSDLYGPYSDMPPPVPAPVPAPRYGYAPPPAPDYGYRDDRYPPPDRPYRPDGYRPDGYRSGPDYGYAPAFLPPNEVYAILRDNGFSPLSAPRQRGNVYVISVLDREGDDGRLVIDARSGRILRFVPASQWGDGGYEHMRYEPNAQLPRDVPRGGTEMLPEPIVIKADPRLLQGSSALPVAAPRIASRTVPQQAPRLAATPVTRPAQPAQQTAAVQTAPVQPRLADAAPAAPQTAASVAQPPAVAQTPGSQVLPTRDLPKVQGLE